VGYCYSSLGKFAEGRVWFERAVGAEAKGDVHGEWTPRALEPASTTWATAMQLLVSSTRRGRGSSVRSSQRTRATCTGAWILRVSGRVFTMWATATRGSASLTRRGRGSSAPSLRRRRAICTAVWILRASERASTK